MDGEHLKNPLDFINLLIVFASPNGVSYKFNHSDYTGQIKDYKGHGSYKLLKILNFRNNSGKLEIEKNDENGSEYISIHEFHELSKNTKNKGEALAENSQKYDFEYV